MVSDESLFKTALETSSMTGKITFSPIVFDLQDVATGGVIL